MHRVEIIEMQKSQYMTASAGHEVIIFLRRMQLMQMTRIKKSLSLFLCTVLIAAMALFTTGCNDSKNNSDTSSNVLETSSTSTVSPSDDITVLGEGQTKFFFTVVDADGKETKFEIHTDKTTVGEALLELELIAGEEGPYGLYVKTVNGITVDYDTDGKYWAFYINGEYATTGVDSTEITKGETYSFKVE